MGCRNKSGNDKLCGFSTMSKSGGKLDARLRAVVPGFPRPEGPVTPLPQWKGAGGVASRKWPIQPGSAEALSGASHAMS